MTLPTFDELLQLDDQLTAKSVPIFSRPFAAARLWGQRTNNVLFGLENEEWFRGAYASLHPSVDFSADSFLTLAVSARGVSYALKPPIGFGRVAISPIKHVTISEREVGRLYYRNTASFWELQWQALDGVDLFMAYMNFHPDAARAKNMMITAVNQLTASSRQLIASELDSSLPQGIAMAVELAGKAVLASQGFSESDLRAYRHNLPKIAEAVTSCLPSPCDAHAQEVANALPEYVDVRYDAPVLTIVEGQHLFAKGMFMVSDFLRRTNHDQLYWKAMDDAAVPNRTFDQIT